ncbi:MAG: VWA domain-containing protein [Oceanococcus sp.]|nr:MAG: VWA domain-containing protein [Oceanococcus sp.]
MKFRTRSSGTSFYETVSDLMFGTMAIVVMLMCIFMVLNRKSEGAPATPPDTLEQQSSDGEIETLVCVPDPTPSPHELELGGLQAQVDELRQSLASAQEENRNANEAFGGREQGGEREAHHVQLVIAVDVTGSMQRELDELAESIALLGETLPRMVNSVAVGVVAYRRDAQNRDVSAVYPLSPVRPAHQDQGRSAKNLRSWVQALRAEAGSAPLGSALKRALAMFDVAGTFHGQQVLMVLGDVGPFEDGWQDQSITAANREQARALVEQVAQWQKSGPGRRLLALFSGLDEIAKSSGQQQQKFLESQAFFRRLGDAVLHDEAYSENSSDMTALIFLATLG